MSSSIRVLVAVGLLVGCSEAPPGAIRIQASGEGELFIDARPSGSLVHDTVIELPEGSHVVEARRNDQILSSQTVDVRSSQVLTVAVRGYIPPPPPPPALPPPPPPPEGAPATPSRSDIVRAMNAIAPAVSECGQGAHGLAPVRIVFGPGGQVTTANVSGGNFPPAVRACIARAARGATVPPFRNPTFSVNYPFRL